MMYKNTFLLFVAEGFTAVAAAAAGLMVARLLPVADFGGFSTAFAFAQIISVLVDSGMGALAAKNIARPSSQGGMNLDHIFTWRLLMIVAFSLISPCLAWIVLPATSMRIQAAVLTPAVMLLTMTDFVSWIFKGTQNIKYCVILQVGSRTLLLLLSAGAFLTSHRMPMLLAAYGISGAAGTFMALSLMGYTLHPVRLTPLPKSFFIQVLPSIYKLGGILILAIAFSRMDLLLVAKYCGSLEAGLYSGAARVVDGLRLIPTVALGICLPMFSRLHDQPVILRRKFQTAYWSLLVVSTVLAVTSSSFAEPAFRLVLGSSYMASVALFQPLVWSCILMYVNMLMFALLYALNDHRTPAIAILSAMALNLSLNVALLSHSGAIAASWSRFAAEGLLFAVHVHGLLRKKIIPANTLLIGPLLIAGVWCAINCEGGAKTQPWLGIASVIIPAAAFWQWRRAIPFESRVDS